MRKCPLGEAAFGVMLSFGKKKKKTVGPRARGWAESSHPKIYGEETPGPWNGTHRSPEAGWVLEFSRDRNGGREEAGVGARGSVMGFVGLPSLHLCTGPWWTGGSGLGAPTRGSSKMVSICSTSPALGTG
jgi:hypothetical protein